MQGDDHAPVALAGFMMTADEWRALDAPSRALLIAIATKPEDLAKLEVFETPASREASQYPWGEPVEGQLEMPMFAVGTGPITDEEATR